MKKPHFIFFVLFIALLLSFCGRHYYFSYQWDKTNTGSLFIQPTSVTTNTYVTINDSLILHNRWVRSITIDHMPAGVYSVHYTCYNDAYQEKMDVQEKVFIKENKKSTQLISVPPLSTGFWVYYGLAVFFPLFTLIVTL